MAHFITSCSLSGEISQDSQRLQPSHPLTAPRRRRVMARRGARHQPRAAAEGRLAVELGRLRGAETEQQLALVIDIDSIQ